MQKPLASVERPTRVSTTDNLPTVQLLRAVAAISVVVLHCWPKMILFGAGVDLFFAISGFIMVHSSRTLFKTRGARSTFIERRIIRVAPLYWIATIVFAPVSWIPIEGITLPMSFFFIPSTTFPLLPIGWTLNYEMMFYAVFAAFLFLPLGIAVTCIACALIAIIIYGHVNIVGGPPAWANSIMLEFIFGMIICTWRLSGQRMPRWCALAVGILAVGVLIAVHLIPASISTMTAWWWRPVMWGLPTMGILLAAVMVDWPWPENMIGRFLLFLGSASYSIYLFHYTTVIAIEKYKIALPPAAVLFTAIGIGCLVYILVERPMLRSLRRVTASRPAVPVKEPSIP